jgi:hypothetical protein
MRQAFVVVAVLAVGCGGGQSGSDGAAGAAGAAGVDGAPEAAAGAGGDGSSECNDLPDNAPVVMPACPGGTTCPDCASGDGMGGAIVDGTYVMTAMTVWASGCGIVTGDQARATLTIRNGTMELVSTGPVDFSNRQ